MCGSKSVRLFANKKACTPNNRQWHRLINPVYPKTFLKVFEGVIGGTFAKVPPNKNFFPKSSPHKKTNPQNKGRGESRVAFPSRIFG
jgi:hypothetical protein